MPETNNSPSHNSMERIVPDELTQSEATGSETLKLHMERYDFAMRNLISGTVLDMACGVGYGSAHLAASPTVSEVTGVDISDEAVGYARQHYGSEQIVFICSPALGFKPEEKFDNIVSLETIEHVDDPNILFAHLVSLLKPGGRLIASVPVTPSVDANPHHKTNFTAKSFLQMGRTLSLKEITTFSQIQRYSASAIILRQERRAENLRRSIPMFYLQNPSHFFLRVASLLRDGFVNKYLTVVWEK